MAIASAIFWVVVGIVYIIYQGCREDAASTLGVVLIGLAVPAAGGVLYLLDKLLTMVHPLLPGFLRLIGIIAGMILFFVWCDRSKKKDEEKSREFERKFREHMDKVDRMHKTGEYTEEFVNKMIRVYSTPWNLKVLELSLGGRKPTPEEIRDRAIKYAREQWLKQDTEEAEKAAEQ